MFKSNIVNINFDNMPLGKLYNQVGCDVRLKNLLGFALYTCFKMVNRVSDFIDSTQKDIDFTILKSRKSMLCPNTDNIVKLCYNFVVNYVRKYLQQ